MKYLVLLLFVVFCLTACGGSVTTGDDTNEGSINEAHITLKDGRVITCLVYARGYKGGLSCDWISPETP